MPERAPAHLKANADDLVLWASYGASPAEWQIARVLWAGPETFLCEYAAGGCAYQQLLSNRTIRAIGTLEQLLDTQRKAAFAVTAARQAVQDLEALLDEARAGAWAAVARALQDGDLGDVRIARAAPPKFDLVAPRIRRTA